MSKIARYQGNVRAFASNAQGMERTVFGGTNQADDLTSQITASFLRGWGIVGASEHPSLEDFNAAMYSMSQFIAYQHQMGVPEWHVEQEYHLGSICTHNGESYQSLQNANVGSQPPSVKWTPVLTSKNGLANLQLGEAAKRAVGGGANQIPDMGFFQAII
ncbi:TPA: carbohydrate-binding protein, partial [Citrobacter braakii]